MSISGQMHTLLRMRDSEKDLTLEGWSFALLTFKCNSYFRKLKHVSLRQDWRNSSLVKSIDCSSRWPRFDLHHIRGHLQASAIPVPRDPVPSSSHYRPCTHTVHRYTFRQTLIQIKINLKTCISHSSFTQKINYIHSAILTKTNYYQIFSLYMDFRRERRLNYHVR